MSTWTLEEANELADENGGGNDAARHIWLQRAPDCGGRTFSSLCSYMKLLLFSHHLHVLCSSACVIGYGGGKRPKDGDRIEVYKQFVIDCYDQGMFRASEAYTPGQSTSSAPASTSHVPKQTPAPATATTHSRSTTTTASAVTVDLLNDDHFSGAAPAKPSTAANDFAAFMTPAAPTPLAAPSSHFHDDGGFSAFQVAQPVSPADTNAWGDFVQSPSAATSTSQHFGAVPSLVPSPAPTHQFPGQPAPQPFGNSFSAPAQAPFAPPVPQPARPTQQAISSVLSMFDAPVASPTSAAAGGSGNGLSAPRTGMSPMGGMSAANAISSLGAPLGGGIPMPMQMPMQMHPQGGHMPMGFGAPQQFPPQHSPHGAPMGMAPMGRGGWPGAPVSPPGAYPMSQPPGAMQQSGAMMGGYGAYPAPQTGYGQPTMSMSSNGMMKSSAMSMPSVSQMNQGSAGPTDNFGFVQGLIKK